MNIIICELVGTMLLVLLGDSICMNLNLNKSGNKGGGPLMSCIGWGFAVMIPAFIFGRATGAHFNPAVTIALAVRGVANGGISWGVVPLYLIGEMLGGFVGAVLCTIMYYNHLEATPDNDVKRGCYCTSPSIRNTGLNLYSEIVDSFILMFAILGIGQTVAGDSALNYVFIWAIITGIGTAKITEAFHHNSWMHAAEDFQACADGLPDPAIADPVVVALFCSSCWRYDGEYSPNGGRRDICTDPSTDLIPIEKITVPTLILCGDRDPYLNYGRLADSPTRLPAGSSVDIISGGGHVLMLEAPFYHAFQEKVLNFLQ